MILVMIRMEVAPEKRKELSQAITGLMALIRTEKGCRRCEFCHNEEGEHELCLLEEWDTESNLTRHLRSELFKVFLGAMNLLQKPQEMRFYTDLSAPRYRNLAKQLNLS